MSRQLRGYASSAAARAADLGLNDLSQNNARSGRRLSQQREGGYAAEHAARYYDPSSDFDSPEPQPGNFHRGAAQPSPFRAFPIDGYTDSGSDVAENDVYAPPDLRPACSEPVHVASYPHGRDHHHHRSSNFNRSSRHRTPGQGAAITSSPMVPTERESLLNRVRELSASEAETAAAYARVSAEAEALAEEASHWRDVAKEATAARRAAREALSDVSAENARLAAALSSQQLESAALQEALSYDRCRAASRISELERALSASEERLAAQSRSAPGAAAAFAAANNATDERVPSAAFTASQVEPELQGGTAKQQGTWDQERQELLSLLERLQDQLASHATQHGQQQQQTSARRPSSAHRRQAPTDQARTPERQPPCDATSPGGASTTARVPASARPTSPPGSTTPLRSRFKVPASPPPFQAPSPAAGAGPFSPSSERSSTTPAGVTPMAAATPANEEPQGVQCESSFESEKDDGAKEKTPLSSGHGSPAGGNGGVGLPRNKPAVPLPPQASVSGPPPLRSSASVPERKSAAQLKATADRLAYQKRFDDAVKAYSEAVTAAETEGEAHFVCTVLCARARALAGGGRLLESAADCCRVEKMEPGRCVRALDLRAEAHFLMGAFDLAVEDLERLQRLPASSGGGSPALAARLQDARREAVDGEPRNHYAVLGVRPGATSADIKAAYRSLALRLHPDKAADTLGRGPSTALFSLLSAAHAALGTPQGRRAYDLDLLRHKYASGGGGLSRRSWQ